MSRGHGAFSQVPMSAFPGENEESYGFMSSLSEGRFTSPAQAPGLPSQYLEVLGERRAEMT